MKKIELATEVVQLMNEKRQYNGDAQYTAEEAKKLAAKTADRNTMAQLEKLLDESIISRDNAKRSYYTGVYKHTEAYRELHDKAREARDAWMEDAYQETITVVEKVLGKGWRVDNWGSSSCRIGMKETDPTKDRAIMFGHDFELRFGFDYVLNKDTHDYDEVFKFTANAGTMGEFNIEDGDSQRHFWIGYGKFLAAHEVVDELKDELKQLAENLRLVKKQLREACEAYVEKQMAK